MGLLEPVGNAAEYALDRQHHRDIWLLGGQRAGFGRQFVGGPELALDDCGVALLEGQRARGNSQHEQHGQCGYQSLQPAGAVLFGLPFAIWCVMLALR